MMMKRKKTNQNTLYRIKYKWHFAQKSSKTETNKNIGIKKVRTIDPKQKYNEKLPKEPPAPSHKRRFLAESSKSLQMQPSNLAELIQRIKILRKID